MRHEILRGRIEDELGTIQDVCNSPHAHGLTGSEQSKPKPQREARGKVGRFYKLVAMAGGVWAAHGLRANR